MRKAIAITILVLSAEVGIYAQEGLFKYESVQYINQPVAEALRDLGTRANVTIDCDPKLVEASDGVTLQAEHQEIGRLAARILRPLGLRLRVVGPGHAQVEALEKNDEFIAKREKVFEFSAEPRIERDGDRVTIHFESRAFCDVTVAIENSQGQILRHLGSGVLGENAPEPFQWNSRKQVLVWDGKDDKGAYIDDKDDLTVRVSLGLQARYEKSLFWEPKKRSSPGFDSHIHTEDTIPVAAPEGVYVFEGNGLDHVRLFDHDGNYARAVYPFPAEQLKNVKGLKWQDLPQGYARPKKNGLNQTSFLTSGGRDGRWFLHAGAYAMAVAASVEPDGAGRIALVGTTLNRLSTSGATPAGLSLDGPDVFKTLDGKPWDGVGGAGDLRAVPVSCAFSPNGDKLYLAGYSCIRNTIPLRKYWLDGVACVDFNGNSPPATFKGEFKQDGGLQVGVACDAQGRVYVSEYIDNSVDVYDANGKLLKKIAVEHPTQVCIDPKSGALYVFSWYMGGVIWHKHPKLRALKGKLLPKPTLTVLKSFDDPKVTARYALPRVRTHPWDLLTSPWERAHGTNIRATVDFWTAEPTVWLVPDSPNASPPSPPWSETGILLLRPRDGKLEIVRDFGKDTVDSVVRATVDHGHQRLYVNPANKKLYISERETGVGGGQFKQLVELDPDSGAVSLVNLPFSTEDMTFDMAGRAYLRRFNRVVRYDARTWREIPWDYGEEQSFAGVSVLGSLELPASGTVCFSEGGLYISPRGHLAVSCSNDMGLNAEAFKALRREGEVREESKKYRPTIYPGRINNPITACVHIWDEHGKVLYEDAVPGMTQIDGIGIDAGDNIYAMSAASRVYGGQKYPNPITGTLLKVRPKANKWLSNDNTVTVPMQKGLLPKRKPDLYGYCAGTVWIDGVDWLYGGVGDCSFKTAPGCICWQQSRFTLDYFARSFAPEMDQFSVAALDSNGNLILRIGQYGNADDGLPLSTNPRLIAPHPRRLGGDEVSFMHPCHVAALTDRYLYVGDLGNSRVVQVKIGYAAEKKIALKSIPDQAAAKKDE